MPVGHVSELNTKIQKKTLPLKNRTQTWEFGDDCVIHYTNVSLHLNKKEIVVIDKIQTTPSAGMLHICYCAGSETFQKP